MKKLSERELPNGGTEVRMRLEPNERLVVIKDDAHYELGGQLEEIVPGHVLTGARAVEWCHHEQKWIHQ